MSATAYDEVPYTTNARTASDVGRIAVLGRLLGMGSAHPNEARVLEVGCGDGGNILPMAVSLTGSQFVGIDVAGTAIARGHAAIQQMGLDNVRLVHADLRDVGEGIGDFDYVIAHGLYSWVPAEIRRALLELIRSRLRREGLAFVSYNALPGDHIRSVVRQMMRMHTSEISDPVKKMEQARALLSLLASVPGAAGEVYRPLLQSEVGRALHSSDDLLFHDDLAEITQPFFVSEFVSAARAVDLQFAAEVPFHAMNVDALPMDIAGMLRELGARDLVAKEQYLDFLTCRGFRQTLLCHAAASIDRSVDVDRVRQFRFSTEAVNRAAPDSQQAEFSHPNGSVLKTENRIAVAALTALGDASPRSIPCSQLVVAAQADDPAGEEALAEVLYRGFSVGVLEFSLYEPPAVFDVSDRPRASSWARVRAETGRVANLHHEMVDLDPRSRALLLLMDGTRTVGELAVAANVEETEAREMVEKLCRLGLLVS